MLLYSYNNILWIKLELNQLTQCEYKIKSSTELYPSKPADFNRLRKCLGLQCKGIILRLKFTSRTDQKFCCSCSNVKDKLLLRSIQKQSGYHPSNVEHSDFNPCLCSISNGVPKGISQSRLKVFIQVQGCGLLLERTLENPSMGILTYRIDILPPTLSYSLQLGTRA